MMLKSIIYGYMNNVYSCRKIEERQLRDMHFIWLSRKGGITTLLVPSFRLYMEL